MQKKTYSTPTFIRHGDAVQSTLGIGGTRLECYSWAYWTVKCQRS